jgi:hypothetical protein
LSIIDCLESVDRDGIVAALFAEFDRDVFVGAGGDGFADEVGFDGKLAVAAVDEDGELDAVGAADVAEGIERGAGGASGVDDVINEDDGFAGDVARDGGGVHLAGGLLVKIVAVHGDIDDSSGDRLGPNFGEGVSEALGEVDAAALDADENEVAVVFVAFGDFVRDAVERSFNDRGAEEEFGGH